MERIAILSILVALLLIHVFVVQKVAFLSFYYLPVLLAGYFCGKRTGLLLSILALFLVILYSLVQPGKMSPELVTMTERLGTLPPGSEAENQLLGDIAREKFKLYFSLATWGSFLVLSGIISSVLYDHKQKRIEELRSAYVGVVEILTKYLELADRYSSGRSLNVAEISVAIARKINLREEAVGNIRIAGLLHDMGHKDVSSLILEKSAELGKQTGANIRTFSISGDEVLRSVSSVLEGVAPIVNAYHEYFVAKREKPASERASVAAEIIAVARAYYDMVTGSPTRKPKSRSEAIAEIRGSAGKEFDPQIIDACEKALQERAGDMEPNDRAQEPGDAIGNPQEGA